MKFSVAFLALAAGTASASAQLPKYKSPRNARELDRDLKQLGLRVQQSHQNSIKADASNCSNACASLKTFKPKGVILPTDSAYDTESASYWSALQAEVAPACYFLPEFANEAAGAVLTAEFYKCPFAVRSGGHAPFAGASNIADGISIDLKKFDRIKVSTDKKVARVGTGLTWGDVYTNLDKKGLGVIGGRVSDIGTGGLTLGGGVSFFSGRYGWACDNVENYELVTGGGRILSVNDSDDSYPDLYRALRGGGNNFGIVTRLDLSTHKQGKMWGGLTTYSHDQATAIYKALNNFVQQGPTDPDAHTYVALAYAQGTFIFSNSYDYAKPTANPPIFHEFTAIPNMSSTTRITTLHQLTAEINKLNPAGLRETSSTATYSMSVRMLRALDNIFRNEIPTIADVDGLVPFMELQGISTNTAQHFHKRGGNSLGIAKSETPLLLVEVGAMWSNAADDDRVLTAMKNIISRGNARAQKLGLSNDFIYQNYASADQNVFAGYGSRNLAALKAASAKYDPRQVFQDLVPGYFKLSNA